MAIVAAGFDVTSAVPVRVRLLEIAPDNHVVVVVAHHISTDGFSAGPMTRDLITAYVSRAGGDVPSFAPLAVQYADYTLWQREVLGSEDDGSSVMAKQLAYWTATLAGAPDELVLPTDRSRPATPSYAGGIHKFALDAATVSGLESVARANGATLFMAVHAALAVVMSRLSGSEDVSIGSPVAGRGDAALNDIIGMFVNTLVLRTQVDPAARFSDLLNEVRATDVAAFGNADVPFERLVEVLDPERVQGRNPLFQVMLVFQNFGANNKVELPGLTIAGIEPDVASAKVDLEFGFVEGFNASGQLETLYGSVTYARDLFDESTVAAIVNRLLSVFAQVIADPSAQTAELSLLTAAELAVIEQRNETGHDVPRGLLLDAFDRQVAKTPNSVALVDADSGSTMTYAEFDARINQLANYLVEQGVGVESLVGVKMRRSLDLLVALYAVLRAGGAYVPLDPDHPEERTQYVLDVAKPVAVLSNLDLELSHFPTTKPAVAVRPENPAYVIFTSGSTGRPKGVAVSHASVVNQIAFMAGEYSITDTDVVLLKTPFTFDVSVWELFTPLIVGARIVVANADGHRDPEYLAATIARHAVTMVSFVPSMLSVFVQQAGAEPAEQLSSLRAVMVAGEALPVATVAATEALVPNAEIHNLYGPTEFTVHATITRVTSDVPVVPIGRPVWNAKAYVLDNRLRPVPDGVAGELYLSGDQVARGYFGRVDLTSERFVADPFAAGQRMYRTGDLVRWNNVDQIEYLGRTDFQVKLRGLRIELGEIESVLAEHVDQVSVQVRGEGTVQQLVAYLVGNADVDALRRITAERLPAYMVPTAWFVLDEFPLNASGKLDRLALPEPSAEVREFRAPETVVQEIVAGVFADVLGIDRVGLDDDFFALGGNSLLATQIVARLGKALDATIPVRTVFEASTVEQLAARAESHTDGGRTALVAGHDRSTFRCRSPSSACGS